MSPPVGVLGGGSFGQGLAKAAERSGRRVLLWSRTGRGEASDMVKLTKDLKELSAAEVTFVAVPSPHVRDLAAQVGRHLDGSHYLVHVSRGLEGDDLTPLTRLLRDETPCRRIGVLAGPLIAEALLEGTPSGAIVGTLFPEVVEAVRGAISSEALRIYSTDDVVGVEIGSAVIGLLALAGGMAKGLQVGPASLAVLVTRGLAEAARLGVYLGAEQRTFSGLAAFGDAIAFTAGDHRPESTVGQRLAEGIPLESAVREAGAYVEGLTLARRMSRFAEAAGIDLPVVTALADVIDGVATVDEVVPRLMLRPPKRE